MCHTQRETLHIGFATTDTTESDKNANGESVEACRVYADTERHNQSVKA